MHFQLLGGSMLISWPSSVQKQMVDLLEGWLRHKSDMVNFEAARALCEMKNVAPSQLTKSIAGRQSYGFMFCFCFGSNYSNLV